MVKNLIDGVAMHSHRLLANLFPLFALVIYTTAHGQELSFLLRGASQFSFTVEQLAKEFTAKDITVWEPHESREVAYRGFAVTELLDKVYGSSWREQEEVLFTCSDGYQPTLPVQRFKTHSAYLVFQRLDQKSFTVENKLQNEKKIELGPFYLVWDNLKSKTLKQLGANGWPYQVVSLDLVAFADRFPALSPPTKVSAQAKEGFLVFRDHCMACHTVNGEGGAKGPELNFPTNVTEYLADKWLQRWLLDPRSMRFNTTMPGLAGLPNADVMAKQVIAYLKSMKDKKVQPKVP